MDAFLQAAIDEAKKGLAEGGIPIGSVLVLEGKIIGRGHKQQVQRGIVIHHAEMNCLETPGGLRRQIIRSCNSELNTTLAQSAGALTTAMFAGDNSVGRSILSMLSDMPASAPISQSLK